MSADREATAITLLVATAFARWLARTLRDLLPRGSSMTHDELAVAVAAQALPLLHTVLIEDDPVAALEELMGDA